MAKTAEAGAKKSIKEFIQNIQQITQTAILPVNAGGTSVPALITLTEYNQPRYTGLEIIYTPDF